MPQNAFFFSWTCDLLVSRKMMQRHFFSNLHPLSPVIFSTATVWHLYCFAILGYTQREATPTQKSARKWCCDLSRHLVRKITKSTHSCKPASLNRPINTILKLHQNLSCHEISPHMSSHFTDFDLQMTKHWCQSQSKQHSTLQTWWKYAEMTMCSVDHGGWSSHAHFSRQQKDNIKLG